MCGICGVFGLTHLSDEERRATVLKCSQRLRHRGPDWSGLFMDDGVCLAHERLSIVDPNGEGQPLKNGDGSIVVSVNGEIYNHAALEKEHLQGMQFHTKSDCECIAHLYEKFNGSPDFIQLLDGDFAFILWDSKQKTFLAARDPTGVNPLYYGKRGDSIWFASELKAIVDQVDELHVFEPGHYFTEATGFVRYYNPKWIADPSHVPTLASDLTKIRESFERAVEKRLMTDTPYGVLLSGGLDSSLVASVASRFAEKRVESGGTQRAWFPGLHSFSIGLEGASDLPFAQKVADFLGTVHHEFHFTIQQAMDALVDVVRHLETFDVTTIRASTPMFLLSRKIKAMGVKMVLSGEGSDELMAGYLYFHLAPNASEMQKEIVSRVRNLHLADNLRANKSTMAWGVEARVPFLDRDFIEAVMNIDPTEKMHGKDRMEKHILRKAFDTPERPYLPDEVLWRQKEQFSDGCGYGWIDALRDEAEKRVSDEQMAAASDRFPHLPPATKEAYWFRTIFDELFPGKAETTVMAWVPAWSKSKDPSGRAQKVHAQTTEQ